MGRRSALPMLPRSAFHENGFADAPVTNAPVAPPASADRSSAPTLPGSWTSATASTRASGRAQRSAGACTVRRAMAAMPDGERSGLTASKARSSASAIGRPRCSTRGRDVRFRRAAEARRGHENDLEAEPGVERFTHRWAPSSSTRARRDRGWRPARGTRRRRDCGGSRWCAQSGTVAETAVEGAPGDVEGQHNRLCYSLNSGR